MTGFAVLPLFLLAACGGGGSEPSPTPSPTAAATTAPAATAPVSGPSAFLADVSASGFGGKDTSDPAFVSVGNVACQGFADGTSYGMQVEAFVTSDAKPTRAQAEALIRSAVRNMCPEYSAMLPR